MKLEAAGLIERHQVHKEQRVRDSHRELHPALELYGSPEHRPHRGVGAAARDVAFWPALIPR
jgi:hypothetical protein